MDVDMRRRRVLYRAAHRGTREMDHLVGRFAEAQVPAMSEAVLTAFESFVTLPDPLLQGWFYGPDTPAETAYADLIGAMRRFHRLEISQHNERSK